MVCKRGLITKAKLKVWGILQCDTCVLCSQDSETCGHLFFKCPYVDEIWESLLHMADIWRSCGEWEAELTWMNTILKRNSLEETVLKFLFSATVYHCWEE
uniref:Reverse transcriptase zinc-binding domain-containing protein n=1 Tax=Davidia involucrata TaxID=16924 RepID=A0A5B7B681_DAVIN